MEFFYIENKSFINCYCNHTYALFFSFSVMEMFYKRTLKESSSSLTPIQKIIDDLDEPKLQKVSLSRIEVDLANLPSDPNDQDVVWRAY